MIISQNGISQDGEEILTTNLLKMLKFSNGKSKEYTDPELIEYLETIKSKIQICIDSLNYGNQTKGKNRNR
jgi:hypothetical protein